MRQELSRTYNDAERAIGGLKSVGLAATPKNLELWLLFLEGKSPSLTRDIAKVTRPDGSIGQDQADLLHDTHIIRQGLSRDLADLIQRFEDEMAKIGAVVESTGADASGNSEKLRTLSTDLKRAASDNPAISALMDSVLAVARSVREANERLEDQLAKSSDEVVNLRRNIENIQQEAMLDPLTGIRNRKTFDHAIANLTREAAASGEPLALIMADVDHFKQFNDRWGHQTGDHVLRLVAEVMNANVKGADVLARYGGEEFAIILPGTSLPNAVMLADRIRKAVEARRLKKRRTDEDLGLITLSMGAAQFRWNDTIESFVERADKCLYTAKKTGRNRVIDETSPPYSAGESAA